MKVISAYIWHVLYTHVQVLMQNISLLLEYSYEDMEIEHTNCSLYFGDPIADFIGFT